MNQINVVKPKSINFSELVKNSDTTRSLTIQSNLVNLLNEEFTEDQQKLYVAGL